jgi:uncharacterized protein YacL
VIAIIRRLVTWLFARFEGTPASGQLLLWLFRGVFGAIIISAAMITFQHLSELNPEETFQSWIAFALIIGAGVAMVVTDIMIRDKQITTISAIYFGLLLGLLLGNILSTALEPFLFDWTPNKYDGGQSIKLAVDPNSPKDQLRFLVTTGPNQPSPVLRGVSQRKALVTLLITVFCCYITISTLLQTKDEFRFIIPYVEFSKQIKGAKPLVLDTSVIIDGRIADICDTRFIDNRLIVPRFVLQELQSVADSSDKLKRNRGRRGLDMLKRMQNNNKIDLVLHDANFAELREINKVDERLVMMAKVLGARVVTNDYNLNKIAQLQGVEVINLNELANALKSVALPGEIMNVKLVKVGDQLGQGVGYLEDGTMVVVEQGRSYIGQEVMITVTSVLQTPAGRMIFGRIEPRSGGPN